MNSKRYGSQTVKLENPPSIVGNYCIAGPKEAEGPLCEYFDLTIEDEMWGEESWEKAESKLVKETFQKVIAKANKKTSDINYLFSGDLLNQCMASNLGVRDTGVPFYGIYGACSTMAESLGLGAMMIDGGFADNVVCLTSSHFCAAEKQFRYPLELGSIRAPSSQWTATGSGATVLASQGPGPYITHVTTGKIIDMGVKDTNNMGAAMAPAAFDTILTHFKDTGFMPEKYDLILTGDLGSIGKEICEDLLREFGFNVKDIYNDCGIMLYDLKKQGVNAGASGCGCSAIVLNGYIMKLFAELKLNNLLFVGTGALMSPTSSQQGESIPCIAHAVTIQRQLN